MKQQTATRHRRRGRWAVGIAAAVSLAAVGAAVVEAEGGHHTVRQRADVMQQGGGETYAHRGAKIVRTDHSVEVKWKVRTPKPGSYDYPTGDMVPPGAPPHPDLKVGYPEVYTLWFFVFDHPELCSNGVCDGDDVGDTPARGSAYQLDGEIAYGKHLRMSGKVRLGQAPANGLGLENPYGAEIHVAMAPHGQVLGGDDLVRQLNSPVGGPPFWWAAIFLAP